MKYLILIATLALASCTSVGMQTGVRDVDGFEAGTGHQFGMGLRAERVAGPVLIEGSAMFWGDEERGEETFVNRRASEVGSRAKQLSLGIMAPVAKLGGWHFLFGGGASYQHTDVDIDLAYARKDYDAGADDFGTYLQATAKYGIFHASVRRDWRIDGSDAYTTEPSNEGIAFLIGFCHGF